VKSLGHIEGGRFIAATETTDADRERLADTLRARRAPLTRGLDRSFVQGRNGYDDGLGGVLDRGYFYRKAKAAGVSTAGKFYNHGLASYWGDPNGWVSDLGEVVAKCKAQGRSCEGAATVAPVEGAPQQAVKLAPEIVEEELECRIIENPDLAFHPEKWDEEREKIVEKHGSDFKGQHNTREAV
jgi:hypothetical protein